MDIVIRAAVIFLFLWVTIRITGKREISQMSAFDLILLVTLGDLISQNIMQEDFSLTAGILAVSTFALLSLILARISFQFRATRPLLEGTPRVIVRQGVPDMEILSSERVTLDDLFEAARQHGIRDLREVDLCVLEANGSFSFFTDRPEAAS